MAGPLTKQAQAEAVVRYGPQRFALRELLAQAFQNRNLALRQAGAYERAMQHVISLARGETQRNYGQAEQTTSGTRQMVDEALSALGSAASPFAAALTRERGGAQDRLTEGRANSLQDLTNRRLETASGAAYQRDAAGRSFTSDVGKIQRSYQELASEEGAFTQGRVGELRKERADRQFQRDLAEMRDETTRRGQTLSHTDRQASLGESQRHNRQTEKNAGGKKGSGRTVGGGVKIRTQESHQSFADSVNSALIDARKQKKLGGRSRGEVRDLLTTGRNEQTITDPESGQKLKVPGIKSHPNLASQVAIELAYDGHISRQTLATLHRYGYSLKELGFPYAKRGGRTGGGFAQLNTPAPR